MIISDVFERFSQDSPLSVMAQAVLENAPESGDRGASGRRTYPATRLFHGRVKFREIVVEVCGK
jgi:hypothetical protein